MVLAGLTAGTGLFAFLLRKKGLYTLLAPACLIPGAAFAFLAAKLGYLAFNAAEQFGQFGLSALIRLNSEWFCFVTGGIGYVLAVLLLARLFRQRRSAVLDCFAPAGCLMVAFLRFGEIFLGDIALGELTPFGFPYLEEGSSFSFFPLAVQNEWQEWWLAISTLEALAALICLVYALVIRCKAEGLRFRRCVFLLCAIQMMLELTRSVSLIFFFVHVEQVFCALILVGLIVHAGLQVRRIRGRQPVWAYVLTFLCLLVNGLAQYALDKPYKFSQDPWFNANVGPICLACLLITTVGLCLIYRPLWRAAEKAVPSRRDQGDPQAQSACIPQGGRQPRG